MFELHTNEGTFFVRASDKQIRAMHLTYCKIKLTKGVPLHAIMFAWSRIEFTTLSRVMVQA